MQEESGLLVVDPSLRGILSFDMRGDRNNLEVHVFHASQCVSRTPPATALHPPPHHPTSLPRAPIPVLRGE